MKRIKTYECSAMNRAPLFVSCFLSLVMAFASCSDDVGSFLDEASSDVLTATAGGRLRITPDAISTTTRTTISGKTTTFDDGDIVGCIICTKDDSGKYAYKATSKWKYNSTYRTFLIERYWTTEAPTTSTESSLKTRADDSSTTSSTTLYAYEPIKSDTTNFFISYEEDSDDEASNTDDSDVGGGYTLISPAAGTLYLFFYRPYIDPLETTDDRPFLTYWPKVTEGGTTTYLMGFAGPEADCTFSTTVAKADDSGKLTTTTGTLNDTVKCFDWEEYPVFIHLNQGVSTTTGDDDTSSSTAYGLEVSDGLSAQYEGGVSSSTTEVLRLTFAKQAATVRVLATDTIKEAYLINGQEAETVVQGEDTFFVYSETPITAGRMVSIKSASDVSWSTDHSLYEYRQIQSSDQLTGAIYTPTFDYTAPSGTVDITSAARFHLPPQDDFHAVLKYKLSGDSNYSYQNLDGLGNDTLEAGMRYTVNLFSIDDQYLYVTSSGKVTNGSYLTLGREDGNSLSYTKLSTDKNTATSYTINGTTITYSYRLQNSNGEYLGVFVPTTMTLTLYLDNQSSTPSVVIFETDEDYSGNTLYSSPTFESATDDKGNNILKATVQMEEGFYRVRRSGGTCYLLYATLTM